jgi:hypothetical protein
MRRVGLSLASPASPGKLSAAGRLDTADNARLFEMLYLTAADSAISCWQEKARWLFWRPVTAIHDADRDSNRATEPDRAWSPLINTPPYPITRPVLPASAASW